MKTMLTTKRIDKNLLYLCVALWACAATIQTLALSVPFHLDQQHIQPISRQRPSTDVMSIPRTLSSVAPTHDGMHFRKRMDSTTPNGSKRNPKAKKPGTSRAPHPHRPNISSANKNVRDNNPPANLIHAKSTNNTTKDLLTHHKASKKKVDPPVFAASDVNNHTNMTEPPPTVTTPPVQEPSTDPKVIVLAIVGSLGGLACCFCCLLGVSRIGCCFLHRFAVGKKNNNVVFETVSIGGKVIGPPMPIEDMDEERPKEKSTKTTSIDAFKSGNVPFTEFWNVPETSKDGKRSSNGQKTKGRGSGNVKASTTAHHITSPIEPSTPQLYDRADSPTIYYNPEFAFSTKNETILNLPPPPAVVVAQTSMDPLKFKRMPPNSPQPISKASESFLSNPSSMSAFRLSGHSDTQQQQSQKQPGPKPHPINTSYTWQNSSAGSSTYKSPTTTFPGSGRAGGDEGYFSANPDVSLSPVHPSSVCPRYPPYPPGTAYHVTFQQQPVGFDQTQHRHRIQTPYQSQYRSEYGNQDERYYY